MASLSSGINTALQAILAQSQVIEVIDHNVANASTQGYHRQSAVLSATSSNPSMSTYFGFGASQLGTGVTVERIQRFTEDFFDNQYRAASASNKSWDYQSQILTQMESILSDTSDGGLPSKLDQFWSAWQDLASDPTSTSYRQEVLSDSTSLTQQLNSNAQQLLALQQSQNQSVESQVTQINTLAKSVATLNGQISQALAANQQPNDLLDQRDQALDQLAELAGAVSSTQPDGEVTVSISGHTLVTGQSALALQTEADPDNTAVDKIVWTNDSHTFTPNGGELGGILKVRDEYIPQQLDALNQIASTLITQVNDLHSSGYTQDGSKGGQFFSGSSALDISVVDGLTPDDIAASGSSTEDGDNSVASAIYGLSSQKLMNGDMQTINDYYNSSVTDLANIAQQANDNETQSSVVAQALDTQRQSVSGVSLDEEATNLATAQQVYQAASRVMTVINDLLGVVINQMGVGSG